MIPLDLCVGAVALIFWFVGKYERHITVLSKRYEKKVSRESEGWAALSQCCDLLMEIYSDPQSDEYRKVMDLKIKLEKAKRR
jgi:hypothetical protein